MPLGCVLDHALRGRERTTAVLDLLEDRRKVDDRRGVLEEVLDRAGEGVHEGLEIRVEPADDLAEAIARDRIEARAEVAVLGAEVVLARRRQARDDRGALVGRGDRGDRVFDLRLEREHALDRIAHLVLVEPVSVRKAEATESRRRLEVTARLAGRELAELAGALREPIRIREVADEPADHRAGDRANGAEHGATDERARGARARSDLLAALTRAQRVRDAVAHEAAAHTVDASAGRRRYRSRPQRDSRSRPSHP
jgi:hypothetical protein